MADHTEVENCYFRDGPDWDPKTGTFVYPAHVKVTRPAAWRGLRRRKGAQAVVYHGAPWALVLIGLAGFAWVWARIG